MMEKPDEPNLLVQLGVVAPVVLVWGAVLDVAAPLFRAIGAPINDFLARVISLDLGPDFGLWLAVVAAWILIMPLLSIYADWAEPKVKALLAYLRR